MMQTLLIDRGNTRLKWRLFDGASLLNGYVANNVASLSEVFSAVNCASLGSVWVSNVANERFEAELLDFLAKKGLARGCVHFVKSESKAHGLINGYQDYSKLGVDRWLAMVAARSMFSDLLCVVDCGTACTLDVVEANGQHLGGYIVPGLALMRGSLQTSTEQIALTEGATGMLFGKNTSQAVLAGTKKVLVSLIQKTVSELAAQYQLPVSLVLTGGGSSELEAELALTCHHEADLVFKGLGRYAGVNW